MNTDGIAIIGIILFIVCFIAAVIAWGYAFYYMAKTLGNFHPERKWGKFIAFSIFMPWFFTEQGNIYRKQLLKYSGYFVLLIFLGMAVGYTQMKLFPKQNETTPNKQVKNARYHSLGLLKSGAMLRFLKAPYLSRYM